MAAAYASPLRVKSYARISGIPADYAARTQDRRSRPGGTTGRLGPARGIRDVASPDRSTHGHPRQTRVRPGAAAAGGAPPRGRAGGVREAIARGVIGFDAVKHLVLCRI